MVFRTIDVEVRWVLGTKPVTPFANSVPVMVEQGEALALVRLRRGVVGESRRVCHLIPVPVDQAVPEYLTALCGELVFPGEAEVLETICGMPCHSCMARSPSPAFGFLAAAG